MQTRRVFHCHCRIKVPVHHGEALLDRCFELLEEIDHGYNSHQAGSRFDRINQNAGCWVETDHACTEMLRTLKQVSALTDGSFDITCMPLIRLWGFYRRNHDDIPRPEEIRATLPLVNWQEIAIDGNAVKIGSGQEIITGSFLKAWAVDQVVKLLRDEGVTDAVMNAGGSTIAAINEDSHPHWTVNIPDAFTPGVTATRLKIADQCFSLSGRLNNHLVIGGRTYGHILNSNTGWPSPTAQTGVVTADAFTGDIISTALFAVEKEVLEKTVEGLKEHFTFDHFRIEDDNYSTPGRCF